MQNETQSSRSYPQNWVSLLLPFALILGLVLLLSQSSGSTTTSAPENPLESTLKIIAGYVASGAETAAGLVIGIGVVSGMIRYVKQFFQSSSAQADVNETIRLQLGRVLTLGLEFTVASDILRTAVAPNRQDILNLTAIVLLRTLLNYFLEHEIQQAERRKQGDHPNSINRAVDA